MLQTLFQGKLYLLIYDSIEPTMLHLLEALTTTFTEGADYQLHILKG